MVKLEKLLENLIGYQVITTDHFSEIEVTGITYDSRHVEPGNIFVCIQGFKQDGHDFIDDALSQGATVIVIDREISLHPDQVYIHVQDSREALSRLSEAFYRFPAHQLQLIGVTGTNGKTTTTYMIESILSQHQIKTGLIGTIRNKVANQFYPTERTTPESSDLQNIFAKMVDAGVTHSVMEVSSHALELKRVRDFQFKVGIFTNITRDHLDFHDSLENYKQAKSKLFRDLAPDGVGVINIDDPAGEYMISKCQAKTITYGIHHQADVQAEEIQVAVEGVSYRVKTPVGETKIQLQLTGYFNVYNSLAAIGAGLAFDIPLATIKAGLERLSGVAGRFEQVSCGQNYGVIVDYAHTPDGMENVLKTAQAINTGKMIVVFGCGGDRDRVKRPMMGKIAATYADFSILTSDNPRTEDPIQIITEVEKGILTVTPKPEYEIIPDRRRAIFKAIELAKPGDLVLIMGKGHETYQIFKDETIAFDDREVAREAIFIKQEAGQ